jgi:hypothetical protein
MFVRPCNLQGLFFIIFQKSLQVNLQNSFEIFSGSLYSI